VQRWLRCSELRLQHCPAPALTSVGKMADTDGSMNCSMHKFTDFCRNSKKNARKERHAKRTPFSVEANRNTSERVLYGNYTAGPRCVFATQTVPGERWVLAACSCAKGARLVVFWGEQRSNLGGGAAALRAYEQSAPAGGYESCACMQDTYHKYPQSEELLWKAKEGAPPVLSR